MCGRIVLVASPRVLAATFGLEAEPETAPRYNIAPGADIAAVLPGPGGGPRVLRLLGWGLVASWSRDPDSGRPPINARAETVLVKPAFGEAFARRRCLIPADGFYEWQRQAGGKQPYVFRRRDGRIMALAGFWERWERAGAAPLDTCAIVTTAANALMRPIHDRMPAVLPPAAWAQWLDLPADRAADLLGLLVPCPAGDLIAYPVTPRVNRPDFDDPACLVPVADDRSEQLELFGGTGAASGPEGPEE